jgi:hypothetical protein
MPGLVLVDPPSQSATSPPSGIHEERRSTAVAKIGRGHRLGRRLIYGYYRAAPVQARSPCPQPPSEYDSVSVSAGGEAEVERRLAYAGRQASGPVSGSDGTRTRDVASAMRPPPSVCRKPSTSASMASFGVRNPS